MSTFDRTASPAAFVENRGQWPDDVRYLARLGGLNAWITTAGVTYDVHITERTDAEPGDRRMRRGPERPDDEREAVRRRGHVLQMRFLGGRAPETIRTGTRQPGVHNYFLGDDPSRWARNVPLYDEVTAVGVYEGVDARYYFDAGSVRYDLIVAPGADAARIRLAFDGAEDVRVAEDGALVLLTSVGEVRHQGLHTYQVVGGRRVTVPSRFVVAGGVVRVVVGAYDRTRPLVIDPLIYSTFLGGTGIEFAFGFTVDGTGAAYVSGDTNSTDFPTTTGAYDTSSNGLGDAFVTKLAPDGASLVYSTFLGGSQPDWAYELTVDLAGSVIVAGRTYSTDLPTSAGAHDTSYNGLDDVFVTKLSPDGSALVYSTFLGGSNNDYPTGVAVDDSGAATVVGFTTSLDFPTTPGAFDTSHGGGEDGFVTRVSPDGIALSYSTFLGGAGGDKATGVTVDAAGAAYVIGQTESLDFPTTPGAYDTDTNGGLDVFASKLSFDGTALVYSTLLGNTGEEFSDGVTVDESGVLYIIGTAFSSAFPTTPGAFDETYNGGAADVFVSKISRDGSALIYSTFIGGIQSENGYAIAIDDSGAMIITGRTASPSFPTTADAYDTSHNGLDDVFVTKLTPDGSSLLYSTFLGGVSNDAGSGVAVEASGAVTIAGYTMSVNFPTTPDAYDPSRPGNRDAFVTRFSPLPVSSEAPAGVPAVFTLAPPHPNPASARLTLAYNLPTSATVGFAIYDSLGRRVTLLANATNSAGRHEVHFDAGALAAGVYVVRAEIKPLDGRGGQAASQQLVIVR